jgi:hypothetical protein
MTKRYVFSLFFISFVCATGLAQAIQGRLFVIANVVELCQVPSLASVRSAQRSYACGAPSMNQVSSLPYSQPIFNVIVDDLSSTVTYSF